MRLSFVLLTLGLIVHQTMASEGFGQECSEETLAKKQKFMELFKVVVTSVHAKLKRIQNNRARKGSCVARVKKNKKNVTAAFFILLTHEGSHRRSTSNSNPVMTSSAGGAKG